MADPAAAGGVRRREGIPFQRIGDETLVVDPKGRKVHLLKGSGSRIWDLLGEPTTPAAIRQALAEEFDVTPERAERDLASFLSDLRARGLLAGEGRR